jgi:hypothetical protein
MRLPLVRGADIARRHGVNAYVVDCPRRYVFSTDERQERFINNRMSPSTVQPPFFPTIKTARRRQSHPGT